MSGERKASSRAIKAEGEEWEAAKLGHPLRKSILNWVIFEVVTFLKDTPPCRSKPWEYSKRRWPWRGGSVVAVKLVWL